MTHSFRSSIYLNSYQFHQFISEDTSVHPKMKSDYMQAVSFLTIELQLILRVEGSNNYHFFKKIFKKNLKNLILFLKAGLKSSCDG